LNFRVLYNEAELVRQLLWGMDRFSLAIESIEKLIKKYTDLRIIRTC